MPIPFASLFRVLVMLVLAFHVFYMYCLARVKADTFGFDLGTTILAALFGLAMLVPLVWAFTLPELPEIWTTHVRAKRWWKRGQCPACGYRIEGQIDNGRNCSECGLPLRIPQGYRINAHTIRLFIALNLLAWMIGCAVGESWLLRDERLFERQLAAPAAASSSANWPITVDVMTKVYGRSRQWPNRDVWLNPSPVSLTPAPSP